MRLEKWLSKFSRKKILVVGDVGLDRYTIGAVERISPEAPVPIVRVEDERHKLGLAANVADNIFALRGQPMMVGLLGKDTAGASLLSLFKRSGIDRKYLVSENGFRTILKERIVSELQQLLRVDYESKVPPSKKSLKALLGKVKACARSADAMIVEDYAKGLLGENMLRAVIEEGRKQGLIVAVDPNARTPLSWYEGATLLTPNTREAEALTGLQIRDKQSLVKAGRIMLSRTGAKYVLITRGGEGMALFERENPRVMLIPTYAQEVYDVSGAGDTVISVIALALSSGAPLQEAAVLANLAAGVEVGKRGTATVSPEELKSAIKEFKSRGLKGPSPLV